MSFSICYAYGFGQADSYFFEVYKRRERRGAREMIRVKNLLQRGVRMEEQENPYVVTFCFVADLVGEPAGLDKPLSRSSTVCCSDHQDLSQGLPAWALVALYGDTFLLIVFRRACGPKCLTRFRLIYGYLLSTVHICPLPTTIQIFTDDSLTFHNLPPKAKCTMPHTPSIIPNT